MNKPICFVISPIGDDDSETRKSADDVFDLIIKPAVEKYAFEVIRADKIPSSGSITEDVIRLVQEAELCIVDLTEHNPNVFYECGRRHETGKPIIQIIHKREEKIPFDLAGIITIKYDLADLRAARKAVITIQEYIDRSSSAGFEERKSGVSLAAISDALSRIERKLAKGAGGTLGAERTQRRGYKSLFLNPQLVLTQAIREGDVDTIVELLPRLKRIL